MSTPDNTNDVRVNFCVTADLDESALEAALAVLSSSERARCARFVFARHRRDFAIAHALLRQTLSCQYAIAPDEWEFVADAGGKPMLSADLAAAAGLRFNLAHTEGLVACAVSRIGDVGVDVEALRHHRDELGIARRYFSPAEAADLEHCAPADRPVRFIELWTLKEAYIKAVGAGLLLPLDGFTFRFDGASALRFVLDSRDPAVWSFGLFTPSERHRLAVAVRCATSAAPVRILACPGEPQHLGSDSDAIACDRSVSLSLP
jgi:4'-phosphopantetheinyl transferase